MDIRDLSTESAHPDSAGIHERPTIEVLRLINAEDAKVAGAVEQELENIARVVDLVADRLGKGGRLFYVGAGTSGRLGVLDASECPPTFGVEPEMVQGLIAGGEPALVRAAEGAEDDPEASARELERRGCGEKDVVIGISASGRTPYVIGALKWARELGIATGAVACNRPAEHDEWADVSVNVVVGPEVVTGSTRMKAGTATKLVLNMITTGAMIRLGRIEDGRMVRLRATSSKLRDRAVRILVEGAGVDRDKAETALDEAGGDVRRALESLKHHDA